MTTRGRTIAFVPLNQDAFVDDLQDATVSARLALSPLTELYHRALRCQQKQKYAEARQLYEQAMLSPLMRITEKQEELLDNDEEEEEDQMELMNTPRLYSFVDDENKATEVKFVVDMFVRAKQ
jgi:hypothetical protein